MNKDLYDELRKIGSKERSIKPSALRSYTHLLNSYEVRRRAKGSADLDVRARHASNALKELIDSFANRRKPRHLVVKIRFGIEPGYKNLDITERIKRFTEKENYSVSLFKLYAKEALEAMTELLEPEITNPFDIQEPPPVPLSNTSGDNPEHQVMATIVGAAANLHYALLAGLFTKYFNERFHIEPSSSYSLPFRMEVADACFERVFESMMLFGMLGVEDDADWIKLLHTLIDKTREAMPASASDNVERMAALFKPHLSGEENRVANRLHEECRKWYSGDGWWEVSAENVEPVIARTGAIIILIARHVELNSPVVAEARAAAHKTLAYYYDFDEHTPLFDGYSLHHHIDAYFDNRSLALANSELV